MPKDRKAFGDYLKKMIKQAGITQSDFYTSIKITKPYFYDILSGKVNPPPPEIQYRMLDKLKIEGSQRNEFLNLAAEGREEIPADIAKLIADNTEKLDEIRKSLKELLVLQ